MAVATRSRCASRGLPAVPATGVPARLSRMLLDGALERIGLARACIERGADPVRPLRTAMLQIREATFGLALSADPTLAANLEDLAEYMCRQLGTVDDHGGLTALADVCDLLRELRSAYMTPPAAVPAARAAAPLPAPM